jgi:hypothetical protein
MEAELLKSLSGGVEDQLLEQRLSSGRAEEGIMMVFRDINADQEILFRSSNLTLHLTKHLEPAIIVPIHGNLLVENVWRVAATHKILAGGFFFGSLIIKDYLWYRLGSGLDHGVYITSFNYLIPEK